MTSKNDLKNIDGVLIDDDEIVHKTWSMLARIRGKRLLNCRAVDEFFDVMKFVPPETVIYIDSHLDDGVKGEEMAELIYQKGFQNIYLITGYLKSEFGEMPWLKDILGKVPPDF